MASRTGAALKRLSRAIAKLRIRYDAREEHGPVARRNARQVVLTLLGALRKTIDDEFPLERKERGKTRRRKIVHHDHMRDMVQIPSANTKRLGQLQKAGIKLEFDAASRQWLGPRWAVEAPANTTIATFKRARRSRLEQRALTTLAAVEREYGAT